MSSQMDVSSPAGSVLLQLLTLNISWQCGVSQCHPNVRARVKLSLLFIGATPRFRPPPKSLEETEFDPSESPVPLVADAGWRISMGTVHWEVGRLQKTTPALFMATWTTCPGCEITSFQGTTFGYVPCLSRRARFIFWVVWCVDILLTHVSGLDYACGFCMPYCRSFPAGSLSFWCWTSPSEAMRQLDGIKCNKMIHYYILYYIVTNH